VREGVFGWKFERGTMSCAFSTSFRVSAFG
jgi:hypothetical protein